MKLHNGYINVTSDGIGKGCTFHIQIPFIRKSLREQFDSFIYLNMSSFSSLQSIQSNNDSLKDINIKSVSCDSSEEKNIIHSFEYKYNEISINVENKYIEIKNFDKKYGFA